MKKIVGFCALFLLALGSFGQSVLTFTDLSGFPDVVVDGQAYNLSGYLKNTGTGSSNPVIDIKMHVNGNDYTIDNNYSAGAIASNDSIFWSKPGYVFPTAAFIPGNHNDILIWPTNPSGNPNASGESDTLQKEVFFANSAGFRTRNDGVLGLPPAIDLSLSYSLGIKAVNEGMTCNTNAVKFYFRYEGGPVISLGAVPGIYMPGDTVYYHSSPPGVFNVQSFITHYTGPEYVPHFLEFWAQESVEVEPIAKAVIDLSYLHTTSTADPSGGLYFSFYPNPAVNRLSWINWGDAFPAGTQVEILNLQGALLFSTDAAAGEVDLSSLPDGLVIARILTPEGASASQRIRIAH